MDSVTAVPQIRGRHPVPESEASPLQAVAASLPVKLLAVTLLVDVFADAPASYFYFRLLPRFVFVAVLLTAIFVRSSVPAHSRRVGRSASVFMVLFGIVCTISWIVAGNDFGTIKFAVDYSL